MIDRLALAEVQKGLQGLLSVTSKVMGAPAGEEPEPGEVLEYSLDNARSYELLTDIPAGSDFILASSDGDLSGVQLRVAMKRSAGSDSKRTCYLDQTPVIKRVFNFVFLKNTAQPGKTLRLTIGREASAEAITSISLSQISKWGGTTLSARDVSLGLGCALGSRDRSVCHSLKSSTRPRSATGRDFQFRQICRF